VGTANWKAADATKLAAPHLGGVPTHLLRATGAAVRHAEWSFRDALRPGVAVSGPNRNLWAGRTMDALTKRELTQVNRLLHALVMTMRAGRHDSRGSRTQRELYEVTFVLAPVRRKSDSAV
jgi:hypothetical protein